MTSLEGLETGKTPEKQKVTLEDNARKFTLAALDQSFLEQQAASAFLMTTDWLETNEDTEKKLTHKKFINGEVQILLIAKTTKNGSRTSEKEKITEQKYKQLLTGSVCNIEKMRYEFEYIQDGAHFDVKYDEFIGSSLRVLEVDAQSEEERELFMPTHFPAKLTEVTGTLEYYGYRVTGIV